ncbi:MAG: ABC transporter permease, partial [Candidatus Binatia bacterium]
IKVSYEGDLILLAGRGMKPDDTAQHRERLEQILFVEGDSGPAIAGFALGEGAFVNEAFTERFGRHPGEKIRLVTPSGKVELPILATYFDPTLSNLGVVLIDLSLFQRVWDDRNVNVIEPVLAPGASLSRLDALIRERWAARHPMRIVTLDQFRRDVERDVAESYVFPYALMAIAFAIALVGVVNSLLAAVLDRMPEIGVLRAVGATRRQIAGSLMLEATVMGFSGAVLAIGAGTLFGYIDLDVVIRRMIGITVFYRYPAALAVSGCIAGVVLAALAGWIPGRSAARLRPAEALRYECAKEGRSTR